MKRILSEFVNRSAYRSPYHKYRIFLLPITFWMLLSGIVHVHAQPERVFVINEGAFGQGNASMTVFEPQTGYAANNVFFDENNRLLGDVGNDGVLINGKLYIVINNSHKIEVVDPESYQSLGTISIDAESHGGSPRKMAEVDAGKAYVTNLYGNNVSIIDLDAGEEIGHVEVGPGPEGIVVADGYAFVALSGLGQGNEVAVIDIQTDELIKNLDVGDNPIHIARGPEGKVWSVGTGNFGFDQNYEYDPDLETFGEVVIIDPESQEIVDRFDTGGHPGKLVFPNEELGLLQLNGLRAVDIESRKLQETPFLERNLHSFDIADGEHDQFQVFITLAPDFSSSGRIIKYDDQASPVDSFQAGIGPGSIAFWYGKTTGSRTQPEIVENISIDQNYPNPFNSSTRIRFYLPESAGARLEVFDMLGRSVAVLVNEQLRRGDHEIRFDASGLSSGVYTYRLTADGASRSRRMMHVK